MVDIAPEDLAELADQLIESLQSGVVILALKSSNRAQLVVRVSKDLVDKGLSAVKLIKEVSSHIAGGGGGKADSAQAGGKKPEGSEAALTAMVSLLK